MEKEIAIIDNNSLARLGLQSLLEEIIPDFTIRTFGSFAELMADTPDMFVHYFVSTQIYLEHTTFFLQKKNQTVVLCNAETPGATLWRIVPQHQSRRATLGQVHLVVASAWTSQRAPAQSPYWYASCHTSPDAFTKRFNQT